MNRHERRAQAKEDLNLAKKEEKKQKNSEAINYLAGTKLGKKISEILNGVLEKEKADIDGKNIVDTFSYSINVFSQIVGGLSLLKPPSIGNEIQKNVYYSLQVDIRRFGFILDRFARMISNPEILLGEMLPKMQRPHLLIEAIRSAFEEETPEIRSAILSSGLRAAFSQEGDPVKDFIPVESLSANHRSVLTVKPREIEGLTEIDKEETIEETKVCKNCGRVILHNPDSELCIPCEIEESKKIKHP